VTIDAALDAAVAEAARGLVTVPAELHGFPGAAHGGAVAAILHRLTLPRPPVELHLRLARSVPTATVLRLDTGSAGSVAHVALRQEDRTLVDATLRRSGVEPPEAGPLRALWATVDQDGGEAVPGTATCLACGSANPLGLGVRFLASERALWRRYVPGPAYHARRGEAHPALALIMLDELGWWLGAAAQGECGVTTDVRIALFEPLPLGPLAVIGDRAVVRTDDDPRGRYARGTGAILGPDGTLLASADVRFAGSRAYTRRLLDAFLETTPLDELARWFPGARELALRRGRA
jgi:hypothetical protein